MTCATEILKANDQGKCRLATIFEVSVLPLMMPENAMVLRRLIRRCWGLVAGPHQRLDLTAKEDSSRVRHRNSRLVLGRVRRIVPDFYYAWPPPGKTRANQP